MKAIIVDIEGKYAVAMTKKGTFIKIKNNGKYTVGYEADITSGLFANVKLMTSAASAALFLLAVGLGIFLYTNPYSYINIDINPSVQITANIFDRVIKVTALNHDAEKIIEDLSIKNMNLDQGIEQVVGNAVKNGYLKDEKTNAIMLTVTSTSDRKNKKIQEKVSVVVEKKIKSDKINSEVLIEEVNDKSRNEAIKQGVSPGKLKLVQKLIGLDPSQKAEDLINKPVKEILNSIRYYSKSQKPAKQDNNNDSNKKDTTSNNKSNIKNSKNINNNNNINNNKNNNNNTNNNINNNSNKNKDNNRDNKDKDNNKNTNKNSTYNNNDKNSNNNNNKNTNKNINNNNDFKKAPDTQKNSQKNISTPSTIKPSKDKDESNDKKTSGTDYDSRIETEKDTKDSTDKLQPNNDKNPNNKNKNSEVVEEPKKTNDKRKADSKKNNVNDN